MESKPSNTQSQSKLLNLPVELAKKITDLASAPDNDTGATTLAPKRASANDFTEVVGPLRASRALYALGKESYFGVREWEMKLRVTDEPTNPVWPWVRVTRTDDSISVDAKGPVADYEVVANNHQHVALHLEVRSRRCLGVALHEVAKLGHGKAITFEALDCPDDVARTIKEAFDNGCQRRTSTLRLSVTLRGE